MARRWLLLLLLIPCVHNSAGASSRWSSPALHLKFGCHRVEIQQTAAPRTEGPRSHGKWWESGGPGGGAGDVEPSFDGTGSVVWECGRALCSLLTGDLIACGEEEAGRFAWKMRNPEEVQVGAASAAAVSESDHKQAGARVGVAEEDGDEDERLRMASTVPIEGMAVVELGCGTGLVSILAAKMGARLTIATDKTEMLPLLRHNARSNYLVVAGGNLPLLDPMPAQGQGEGVLVGMPLPWGCRDSLLEVRAELQKAQAGGGVEDGLDDERSTYPDVILGSDLVYGQPEQVLRKLLSTIMGLSYQGRTTVLLAHRHRRDSPCASTSDRFFDWCRDAFGNFSSTTVCTPRGNVTVYKMSRLLQDRDAALLSSR